MTSNMYGLGAISLLPRVERCEDFSLKLNRPVFETGDNICLMLLRSGATEVETAENRIDLISGEAVILFERDIKELSGDAGEGALFSFSDRFAEELLPSLKLRTGQVYYIGNDREINQLSEKIFDEFRNERPNSPMICSSLLVTMLSHISRSAVYDIKDNTAKELDKISPALAAIHSDCTSKDNVEEYAKLCNLSTSYFSHLFTKIIGMSPMDYKRHQRINIAKNLLSSTNLTAKEISTITGFKDPLYFTRCFKQLVGQTPSQFREKKQDKI